MVKRPRSWITDKGQRRPPPRPRRSLSRSDAGNANGDVGVVCGASMPPPPCRGSRGMRSARRRDGVPGDQRGEYGDVGDIAP